MSLEQRRILLFSAPALLLCQGSPEERSTYGTILFYHGLGNAKEEWEEERYCLAQAGFLVVSIDNIGHGERQYPDFDARFKNKQRIATSPEAVEADFLEMVRATAQEVPKVIDDLIDHGWAHIGRIGVAGVSMGGYITYAAILADPRISAATPIIGSPEWKLSWPDSPHRFLDLFFPIALLSQTAEDDSVVSPRFASVFHQQLEPFYASSPQRLRYIEYSGEGHIMSDGARERVRQQMVAWFEYFLLSPL